MREIDLGAGEHIDKACEKLARAAPAFMVFKHPGADLSTYKTVDAKALDAHILLACPDCSGAMHGAAMNALAFIAKQGWNAYAEKMTERTAKRESP